jgi:hypothetical protein
MLTERDILYTLVDEFIKNNCVHADSQVKIFKSYLRMDEFNCFTVSDCKYSIKCIFDKDFVKSFLDQLPSYIKLENFEGIYYYIIIRLDGFGEKVLS